MLSSKQQKTTTFNSGYLVKLNETKGIIISNDGPLIPFGFKTVGIKRYHAAGERGIIASEVIAVQLDTEVPEATLIELRDFETGRARIYRVFNPQRQFDSAPPCWLLTLQETGVKYVDQRRADERLGVL